MAPAAGDALRDDDGADDGFDPAFDDDDGWDDVDDDAFDGDEIDDDDEGWEDDGEDDDYAPRKVTRTLCFGLVAMAPLFLVYEVNLALAGEGSARSVAEAVLSLPLRPLGPEVFPVARRAALAVAIAAALVVSVRREPHLLGRIGRVLVEGAVFALLLGPLLGVIAAGTEPYVGDAAPGELETGGASLARIARASGSAAFEEVLFRVLLLSLAYVASRGLLRRSRVPERAVVPVAALGATLLSALAFAAFHLEGVVAWVGEGGEPFDLATFTWRATAGILLTGIVFWRGVGVGAWAHALFNVVLILGVR